MSDRQDLATFKRVVAKQPMEKLALATRSLILDVMPRAFEVVWERQKTAGYGTGPKKMTEHFCWIALSAKHVSLGFYYGTELPDPTGLLEGTGKLMRHVKVRSDGDLTKAALRRLIVAATKHRVPPLPDDE